MRKFAIAVMLALVMGGSLYGCKKKTDAGSTVSVPAGSNSTVFVSDPNAQRNAKIIQAATSQSISLGLNLLASGKQKAEINLVATKVNQVVTASVLPYLNGASGATSAGVNGFINGQFVDLPSEAQALIALAAMLLDQYLPAPSADSVMNPDQLLYVKAFFQGVVDGTSQFVSARSVVVPYQEGVKDVPYAPTGKWFNPKK